MFLQNVTLVYIPEHFKVFKIKMQNSDLKLCLFILWAFQPWLQKSAHRYASHTDARDYTQKLGANILCLVSISELKSM